MARRPAAPCGSLAGPLVGYAERRTTRRPLLQSGEELFAYPLASENAKHLLLGTQIEAQYGGSIAIKLRSHFEVALKEPAERS